MTVLFGIITVKLIASRLGPEALGSFSLVKQAIVAGSAMFVTGGQTALVQGMSRRTGEERNRYLGTAFTILCGGSVAIGLAIAATGHWIVPWVVPTSSDTRLTIWIAGLAVALGGPMAFVFGSLNGERRIGRLAIAQTLNAVVLAALVWLVLPQWRTNRSYLFALVLAGSQIPGIVLGLAFLARKRLIAWKFQFERGAARSFVNIASATFIAATLQGWTVLGIRGLVAAHRGMGAAGMFDAGWSISMVYVMLILGSFSTYYLPTLAARGETGGKLIEDVLKTSLIVIVPLIAGMMALRPQIIVVLYSAEFLPAVRMMHWMLLGDFFKVLSFVLGMPMLAFADTRAFLLGEIGWNAAMLVGTQLVMRNGLAIEWLGAVFALSYLGYLIYAWSYCRKRIGVRYQRELVLPLISALVVLLVLAALTWKGSSVSVTGVAAAMIGSALHLLVMLRWTGSSRELSPRPA